MNCDPNIYVQPAECNTSNPPAILNFSDLATTGGLDWTPYWVWGTILIVVGAAVVALNIAARGWDRNDRLEEEEE